MRYLGLDLGTKTLGVSISDPTGLIASSYTIIRHNEEYDRLITDVKNIVLEKNVQEIVLGLPKNMNNTEGERCEKTKEFKEMLERRTGLNVILWDERLTTVSADKHMMESGIRREDRKKFVDEIAAVFILQGYLDYLAMHPEEK